MSDYGKEVGGALEIADVDPDTAFTVTLKPGDATLHYTGGNRTDDPRRGLITHFFPRTEFKAQPMAYG